MSDSLNSLREALHLAERRVLDSFRRPSAATTAGHPERADRPGFGERLADRLAQAVGKWAYTLTYFALRHTERHVLDMVRRPAQVMQGARASHDERMTLGERMASKQGRSTSRRFLGLGVFAVIAVWLTLIALHLPLSGGQHDAPDQAARAR